MRGVAGARSNRFSGAESFSTGGALPERRAWQEAREGAYLSRTNLEAGSAPELWRKYIQLTEVEAALRLAQDLSAFRALKSELSNRPLFHQLERRVKAHILVAFLGYALWVTLKQLLRRNHSKTTPAQALALLASVQSADRCRRSGLRQAQVSALQALAGGRTG